MSVYPTISNVSFYGTSRKLLKYSGTLRSLTSSDLQKALTDRESFRNILKHPETSHKTSVNLGKLMKNFSEELLEVQNPTNLQTPVTSGKDLIDWKAFNLKEASTGGTWPETFNTPQRPPQRFRDVKIWLYGTLINLHWFTLTFGVRSDPSGASKEVKSDSTCLFTLTAALRSDQHLKGLKPGSVQTVVIQPCRCAQAAQNWASLPNSHHSSFSSERRNTTHGLSIAGLHASFSNK